VTGKPALFATTTVGVLNVQSQSSLISRLFRSGDTDAVIPLTSTRYSIDALGLPTTTSWYPWYDKKQVSFISHSTQPAFLDHMNLMTDGHTSLNSS